MARNLTASMVTEVTSGEVEAVLLAKFAFPGGDVNFWTGIGNIVFGGDTYSGIGDLARISGLEETELLRSRGATFTLSGIPSSTISLALSENYSERLAKVWLGMLDSSKALVSTPYLLFVGRMDVMEIDEGAEVANITMTVENRLVDLERPKERRYTAEDQKIDFPSDKGLEFVASLNDGKQIVWGKG